MGDIEIRRVYEVDEPPAGAVFLIDRMWPRGVRKEDLPLTGWLRDLAPSAELRTWFGHDPARWERFRERYREELARAGDALDPLLEAARQGPVTLLYAAKDTEHNNALVLRDHLRERLAQ